MLTLQNLITTGTVSRAQRITVYGPNGVGKSTLAKAFPSPIFIDTEDGSTHLDVARIQASEPETFFDALRQLVHCFIDLRSSLMLSLQSVNKTLEIGFS